MAAEPDFELAGDLTMNEVPAVHKARLKAMRSGQVPERIDLSELERTDSSALALLLDWQSLAHSHGRQIEYVNPPRSLMVLARLTQADSLLGWHDTEADQRS